MVVKRKGIMEFKGQDVSIVGEDIRLGQDAPEFRAQTSTWEDIDVLEATKGKVRIFAALPSISTSVCDRETRKFNEEAASLGEDVVIIPISMDVPFTLANWCAAEGIDQVMMLSDQKYGDFGQAYGCLLEEPGILRRAVFVVDKDNKVTYVDYMASIGNEPDYKDVIAAAKKSL